MKQTVLSHKFVEFIPERLEDGVLYVSERYRTAAHRCCCGCGSEVVTPLGPAAWTLKITSRAISLDPSIGNSSLPCRSHYFIRDGRVIWALEMSRDAIEQGRIRDQRLRDAHFAEVNRRKSAPASQLAAVAAQVQSWAARVWRAIRVRFGRSRSKP